MFRLIHCIALTAVGGMSLALVDSLHAQEPGWTSRVLKLGEEREVSEQTPILERPYRPLHFYGNAVRRNYYRGNPWPLPRDILITTAFLAPTPREREALLEQRLAGPNLLPLEPDDTEEESKAPAEEAAAGVGAESELEGNAGPVTASTPEAPNAGLDSAADGAASGIASAKSSPRSTLSESSSRRGRRGRQ